MDMEKNTYKLNIAGTDYVISAEEKEEYMLSLASEVDSALKSALKDGRLSLTQAAVLVALDYADSAKKSTASADNLRGQLKDYLEDAAKAKSERDFYKRELDRIKEDGKANATGSAGLWG